MLDKLWHSILRLEKSAMYILSNFCHHSAYDKKCVCRTNGWKISVLYPLHAVYPTWCQCETCSLWCETTRYLAPTLCMACALHKQDSSQGNINQQFQMIFWIRNDTVISIYALICLLLGGIDGNQLGKGS